jgi:hypothetical protein
MAKRSQNFELVLLGFAIALVFVFKAIFENLFYAWLMRELERRFGLMEAEVIAGFSSIAVPVCASIALTWGLYRYLKRELTRELSGSGGSDRQPTGHDSAAHEYDLAPTSVRGSSVDRWIAPLEAIAALVPAEVRRDFDAWTQKASELDEKIRKLYADSRGMAAESPELSALSDRLRVLQIQEQEARDKKREAQGPVFENLLSQLKTAVVIARGFPVPHKPGNKQRDIDAAEWLVLHLDFESATAFCDSKNGGDQYSGVVIGKSVSASEPTGPQVREREAFVDRAFLGFGNAEIEWLERMNMSGRPTGCPDETWRQLERSGLVDRDFAGPRGIKDKLRVAVESALAERRALANALEIVVGIGSKYRKITSYPKTITETLFVGLRNSHPTRRITNCKISVRLPEDVSAYTYLLDNGISLEAQHEHLVSVAYFHNFKEGVAPLDRVRIPFNAGGTWARAPELPIEPTVITLEAEATETTPRQVRCKIWLDDQRHLQLETTQ